MKRCCYVILAAMALRGQVPSDAEIRAILSDRIDKLHQNVGIAVGIIDANGRRFVSYGNFSVKDPRPVGSDTVFEIGSTTKVFTSTILADMVQRGEVSLDDPAAKYLPAEVKMPERGGKQITLVDLATHASGLPPRRRWEGPSWRPVGPDRAADRCGCTSRIGVPGTLLGVDGAGIVTGILTPPF